MEAIKASLMNGFQKMHSFDDVYLIFNIRRMTPTKAVCTQLKSKNKKS